MPTLALSDHVSLDCVYDAILFEMAVMHPRMPEAREALLKSRLFTLVVAADSGAYKPADLMWLFREAMNSV